MTTCALHASPSEMMNALFGGFVASPASTIGHEKRLEVDLRGTATLTADHLRAVAAAIGQPVASTFVESPSGMALLSDNSIVLHTANRIIITCDMDVPLHDATKAVVDVIASAGFEAEWASFVRKNVACPWDGRDTTMAAEYAMLKEVFAGGRAFVFGPVDSDHYFYFVSDDVRRGAEGVVEADVQINVKMYDVSTPADAAVALGSQAVPLPKPGKGRAAVAVGDAAYESLRVQLTSDASNVVTFETNAEAAAIMPKLAEQIVALSPDRFTVMVLLDPQSATGRAHAAHQSIYLEAERFEGYRVANRTANTFEHGYAVAKVSYVKT